MSRRPKLSLSSGSKVDKKQAAGFEAAATPSNHVDAQSHHIATPADRSEAIPYAAKPSPKAMGVQNNPPSADDKTAPQAAAAWPGGKRFAKVILIVVAAALSLYLLKRRLL